MLTQAYRAAEEVGNILGRKVGIDQLAQIVELLDGKEVIKTKKSTVRQEVVTVRTARQQAIVDAKKRKKAAAKPLTTADGRFTKNLKKVRPESGDLVINAKWVARRYRYEGTPTVEQMLDGVVLFLNFTDPVVVRKFKLHLRGLANPNGFGIEIKHLAYNRIEVKLGDKKPSTRVGLKSVK